MNEKKFKGIYKQVGVNIKRYRKKRSLTQQQLAELIIPKLDRSKISDMENGKEDFQFSTLLRICSALQIEVKDILK